MLVVPSGIRVVNPADCIDFDVVDVSLVLVLELLCQCLAGFPLVLFWECREWYSLDFDGVVLSEDLDVVDSRSVDEFVLGGLVCDEGVDVAALERAYGVHFGDVLLDVFVYVLRGVLLGVVVIEPDTYGKVVCWR